MILFLSQGLVHIKESSMPLVQNGRVYPAPSVYVRTARSRATLGNVQH